MISAESTFVDAVGDAAPPEGSSPCASEAEAVLTLDLSMRRSFAPHRSAALRAARARTIESAKVVGLIRFPGVTTGLMRRVWAPLTAMRAGERPFSDSARRLASPAE
ncbi:ABC transporter permease [Nocardia sp. NPDC056000]|uniref:ABC transporter permease n=1 Tax=Nocardia sp. NPDC056000 TaxID=3345674 RepID=UPI0035DC3497